MTNTNSNKSYISLLDVNASDFFLDYVTNFNSVANIAKSYGIPEEDAIYMIAVGSY